MRASTGRSLRRSTRRVRGTHRWAAPLLTAAFLVCGVTDARGTAPSDVPAAAPSHRPGDMSADVDTHEGTRSAAPASVRWVMTSSSTTADRSRRVTSASFTSDVSYASRTLQAYWSSYFARRQLSFTPVAAISGYAPTRPPLCGQQWLTPKNAAYCSLTDTIRYDTIWLSGEYRRVGDAFVYLVLAHEYGHAIQERLRLRFAAPIAKELQADCLAGAYLGDAVRAHVLVMEPGDVPALRQALIEGGDRPGVPWYAPISHGTPQQRITAFAAGFDRSLAAC